MGEFAESAASQQDLGQRLRVAREAKGLSLEQLAEQSQVDLTLLQDIEALRREPALGTLWQLAAGLGVPFGELLGVTNDCVAIQRRSESAVIQSADGVLQSRPLVSFGSSLWVEAYELTLAPESSYPSEPHARGTRETLVILDGRLRVQLGSEHFDLEPGDSISFKADKPHTYANPWYQAVRYHDVIVYEH